MGGFERLISVVGIVGLAFGFSLSGCAVEQGLGERGVAKKQQGPGSECAQTLENRDQYITALRSANQGAWTQAEHALEAVISTCPSYLMARETLAGWYLQDGRAEDARAVLGGLAVADGAVGWGLLAQIELACGDFDAALDAAEKAGEFGGLVEQGGLVSQIERARIASLAPALWTVEPLWQANSNASEHSPLWNEDTGQLYFTSRRGARVEGTCEQGDASLAPDGQPWEQIYVLHGADGDGASGAVPTSKAVGHLATVGWLPTHGNEVEGGQMVIFNGQATGADGSLAMVTWEGAGGWSEPVDLPKAVNSRWPEYGATFSADGQTLYFSSERPGGYGGRDLYRIHRLPDGMWSRAVVLGPEVNTAGDEDAPFVEAGGGRLFFSSNGHAGMGGFDIYSVALGGFGKAGDIHAMGRRENVGAPINSTCDDTHYFATGTGAVYFTSDRVGGAGRSDIYRAVPKSPSDAVDARQVFTGAFELPGGAPAKVKLVLNGEDGRQRIYRARVGDGQFVLALDPHQNHNLSVHLGEKQVYTLEIGATRPTQRPQNLGRIHLQNLAP